MRLEQHATEVAAPPATPARSERRLAPLMAVAQRMSPNAWALLAVAAAVVLANLPYLLGFFDPNPLGPRSGLLSAVETGLLRGQPTIDPNNGFTAQALGHRAALDWLELRLPWWNSFEGTGVPLAAEMQSAALFPPTLLTLLANGQLYERMLLELIAGLSTFLLLRRISVHPLAAAAAAIAFALNGTFAWFSHAAMNPVAFLPLLLLGIELAYSASAEGRRGGWWLIAVAGALSVLAGFPEVAYINTLLAVFWFAWRCGCLRRDRLKGFAGKAVAGAAVGTLLSAPLLIPALDLIDNAFLGLHEGGHYGGIHLRAEALPQLLLPYVYGPIFGFSDPEFVLPGMWGKTGGFLSTSLLLLGVLGLLSRGRRGLQIVLLAFIVLSLARIYGVPLLGEVFGVLPGMSEVLFYRYAFSALELSVVILAALALDDLARGRESRRHLAAVALGALVLVGLAAVGSRSLADQLGAVFGERPYFEASVVWGVGIVASVAALALLIKSRARTWLVCLVVAVDAMLLFAIPQLSAPREVAIDRAPVTFLERNLGNARFFTLGPFQPNYGSYFGVASLNINDVPVPSVFTDYVRTRLDSVADPKLLVGNSGGGRNPFASIAQAGADPQSGGLPGRRRRLRAHPAGGKAPEGGLHVGLREPEHVDLPPLRSGSVLQRDGSGLHRETRRPRVGPALLPGPGDARSARDGLSRLERGGRRPGGSHPQVRWPVPVGTGGTGLARRWLQLSAAEDRLGVRGFRRGPRLAAVGPEATAFVNRTCADPAIACVRWTAASSPGGGRPSRT